MRSHLRREWSDRVVCVLEKQYGGFGSWRRIYINKIIAVGQQNDSLDVTC